MISTQRPSQSSQSKSRSDFPEGVEVQACTEFRRGFGPEPRAIAPYPPGCSPQSKSRFILPMLPDGQSSSTDNRVLQSRALYYQAAAAAAAANKNNYGRPPNTNFVRSQSLESCTTDNDEVCTCEHNQTMWGTSSSRRASKLPSWPKPQTSTRNDTQDNGGKKSKMLVTIGSSSAQWKTTPRAVQLLATQHPSVMTSHFNRLSAMTSRRIGRQEICQEMAATDESLIAQRNNMMSTRNMVYDELPPRQKPSLTSSHLK